MKVITVFTPTYNRAYCLSKCYESLLRQTSNNFEWLVIDDGSTDDTRELVDTWARTCQKFKIRYLYKDNGGMHSGYNTAYPNISTELAMAVDSDDWLPPDAIEKICNFWAQNKSDDIAGIIGLDVNPSGKVIGDELPPVKRLKVYDFYYRYHRRGDKKMIYRTALMAPISAPEFPGERLFPTCYRYYLLDLHYDMLVLNEPLCVVDYAADGFTRNILRQYKKNLNSFIFYRRFILSYPNATVLHKFKFSIHYVAECLLNREKNWFRKTPHKFLCALSAPFGFALYFYILKRG